MNILFVQVPEEADVSAELLDLLNKMLVKTPCERFANQINKLTNQINNQIINSTNQIKSTNQKDARQDA